MIRSRAWRRFCSVLMASSFLVDPTWASTSFPPKNNYSLSLSLDVLAEQALSPLAENFHSFLNRIAVVSGYHQLKDYLQSFANIPMWQGEILAGHPLIDHVFFAQRQGSSKEFAGSSSSGPGKTVTRRSATRTSLTALIGGLFLRGNLFGQTRAYRSVTMVENAELLSTLRLARNATLPPLLRFTPLERARLNMVWHMIQRYEHSKDNVNPNLTSLLTSNQYDVYVIKGEPVEFAAAIVGPAARVMGTANGVSIVWPRPGKSTVFIAVITPAYLADLAMTIQAVGHEIIGHDAHELIGFADPSYRGRERIAYGESSYFMDWVLRQPPAFVRLTLGERRELAEVLLPHDRALWFQAGGPSATAPLPNRSRAAGSSHKMYFWFAVLVSSFGLLLGIQAQNRDSLKSRSKREAPAPSVIRTERLKAGASLEAAAHFLEDFVTFRIEETYGDLSRSLDDKPSLQSLRWQTNPFVAEFLEGLRSARYDGVLEGVDYVESFDRTVLMMERPRPGGGQTPTLHYSEQGYGIYRIYEVSGKRLRDDALVVSTPVGRFLIERKETIFTITALPVDPGTEAHEHRLALTNPQNVLDRSEILASRSWGPGVILRAIEERPDEAVRILLNGPASRAQLFRKILGATKNPHVPSTLEIADSPYSEKIKMKMALLTDAIDSPLIQFGAESLGTGDPALIEELKAHGLTLPTAAKIVKNDEQLGHFLQGMMKEGEHGRRPAGTPAIIQYLRDHHLIPVKVQFEDPFHVRGKDIFQAA